MRMNFIDRSNENKAEDFQSFWWCGAGFIGTRVNPPSILEIPYRAQQTANDSKVLLCKGIFRLGIGTKMACKPFRIALLQSWI